jgi:2-oxoglutarate ferredoxin oxidoreductase subunit alpha
MPTWYNLRVNAAGFMGRKERSDILIAMNAETIQSDVRRMNPEGLLLVNEDIQVPQLPETLQWVAMPVKTILESCNTLQNLNIYLANMVYVGVLAYLIGIDLKKIESALDYHFDHRRSAIEPNFNVVQKAFQWSEGNLKIEKKFQLKALERSNSHILIDGNTAGALGLCLVGCNTQPGIPLLRQPDWRNPSMNTSPNCAWIRRPARPPVSSCRQRMNWLPLGWRWEPDGLGCVP